MACVLDNKGSTMEILDMEGNAEDTDETSADETTADSEAAEGV